jgi:hypothetical protein
MQRRDHHDDVVAARRRHRDEASDARVETMVRNAAPTPATATNGPFPASLDQHRMALKAAGFKDVDCFWKELRRALVGGYT